MLVAGLLVIAFAFAGNAFAHHCLTPELGEETATFVVLEPIVLRHPKTDYFWKIPDNNPQCKHHVGTKAIVCFHNTRTNAEILEDPSTLYVHNDITGPGAYVIVTVIEYCAAINSDLLDDWDRDVIGGPSYRRTLGISDLKAGLSASWRAGLPSLKNSRIGEALGSLRSSFQRDSDAGLSGSWKISGTGDKQDKQGCSRSGLCTSKAGFSGSWKTGSTTDKRGCSRDGLCSSKAGLLGSWNTGSTTDKRGCSRDGLCNSKAGLLGSWNTGSTTDKRGCSRGDLCSSNTGLSGDLKVDFSSKWKIDPARYWKRDFSGELKADISSDWKTKPSSNCNRGFCGEFKADLSNDWKFEPSSNWKVEPYSDWISGSSGSSKVAGSIWQKDPSTFDWAGEPWRTDYAGYSNTAAGDSPGVLTASLPDDRKTGLTGDWTGYSDDLEKVW